MAYEHHIPLPLQLQGFSLRSLETKSGSLHKAMLLNGACSYSKGFSKMSSRKSSEKAETGFKDEKEEMEEKRREKQRTGTQSGCSQSQGEAAGGWLGTASVPCGSPVRCGEEQGLQPALTALPSVPPWNPTFGITQKGPTHLQNSLWIQSGT